MGGLAPVLTLTLTISLRFASLAPGTLYDAGCTLDEIEDCSAPDELAARVLPDPGHYAPGQAAELASDEERDECGSDGGAYDSDED